MNIEELNLRVFDISPEWSSLTEEQMKQKDFTIPLIKGESVLDKGAKRSKAYFLGNDSEMNEKVVEKIFKDLLDEDGNFYGMNMTVNYYNKENEISYSFDKLIILGVKGGYEYVQKRRKTAFTDLKARAIIYGFKQYIETLYSFFEHELNDYYETGSDVFKNRIIELISNDYEEGTLENGIKTILLSKLDGVYKVSDTMIYQMT